jgi:hypothetical protein
MTQEQQVTTQELCRLNDCITLTMDAIRRVVPQLQTLSFGQSPYFGHGPAYGMSGYGVGFSPVPSFHPMASIDPITASYMNSQPFGARSFFGQNMGPGLPWSSPIGIQTPTQFGGIGIANPTGMGFGPSLGYGVGSSPSWQAYYGSPWQAPYSQAHLGQRVF